MNRRWRTGVRSAPRASESPLRDNGVRQQLARLFGESLFGPWPQLQAHMGDTWNRRHSRSWLWGLSALLLFCACVFVVQWLVQPGLKLQADQKRDHYLRELNTFIADGDLERASQFLALVEGHTVSGQNKELDPGDPHLDLIVATEAALYRYFDASPARLQRIRAYLEKPDESAPLRQLALLTVLSREERASRIRELERLRNEQPDRNDVDYLLATALEQRGEIRASRDAWERSARLEPAWLGHRFEQLWFELRQERLDSARQIGTDMLRVDPDSPWSKLAIECLALPPPVQAESIRGDAAAPTTTPVQRHFQLLTQALLSASRHELSLAKERLAAASTAVQHQAPFLLDAFDWCLLENEPALALELTRLPEWPRGSNVSKAKLERLSNRKPAEPEKSPLSAARTQPAPPETSPRATNPTQ